MEWVPAWESLFETEKRGFLLASRGALIGLSIWARKEGRDGLVRLAVGIEDPAEGIRDLLGGTIEEARAALKQLTDPEDPVIEIGGKPGRLTVRVLSSANWALGRPHPDAASPEAAASETARPTGGGGRPRKWSSEADRSRARRAAATGNPPSARPEPRPETNPVATGNPTGNRPETHPVAGGERGGVSGVQTQKREEEIREEQSADRARTRPETRPETNPVATGNPTGEAVVDIVTAESLLQAVGRHEMLATLHGDWQWALRAVGGPQASGCRAEDAAAAVDAFVTDKAALAPPDGPALDEFVRGNIGRYLKGAKRHGDEARTRARARSIEPEALTGDALVALETFAEVWTARKRRPFVQAVGDEKHAAALVESARPVAAQLKIQGRDVVRFWAEKYLADPERYVADAEHPLRLLPGRLTTYGAPPAKKKPRVPFGPSEPTKAPEAPAAPPPPDWREKLAGVGTNGNAMRRPS